MTVEADIFAALSPLVGGRVFPDVAPMTTQRPYITYAQVGGTAFTYIENTLPDLEHGRFQFDVFADRRAQCNALMRLIEKTLVESSTLTAKPDGAFSSDHDYDMDLSTARQDFHIYSAR